MSCGDAVEPTLEAPKIVAMLIGFGSEPFEERFGKIEIAETANRTVGSVRVNGRTGTETEVRFRFRTEFGSVPNQTSPTLHVTTARRPLRRLRPLQAFRKSRLAPQAVPVPAVSAPVLAPTLAWRHTDAKGRMLLATSFFANDLPENHNADHFGAVLQVGWTAMRPHRLHLPIPLRLPAREVFRGPATQHASSPDTASPPPTWAPPSSPIRTGSAPPVSADTLAGRPLTLYSTAPSGTSGRQGTCPPSAIVPSSRTSTTTSRACSAPASSHGGGTLTAVSGPLVWLPHGFNWRCVPTTPEYQSLRNALALYALHHEEILPSVLAYELERTLPASTPYYPVSMAYLDYRRLRQAYFNSNAVLGPEHFLRRYLASHEVQYVPELGSRQPDRRPVVYVPPHFI
ncbi:hypothetical protein BOTBODRAFT_170908 [Botryobasidium botryosum FD-172 SS1]|uniref:Uncharacterized protein n=1 Tax=Botryobasidium botryosum (strain FD-172 SS1) TaxID=930990 RepID=A0A067N588_BOTB1|nr:hypothetical protein BOTBODRAFT_170908 [Botryobasidium botryosum FD-172 SS1]